MEKSVSVSNSIDSLISFVLESYCVVFVMMSTNTMETRTAAAKFALDWFYCLYLWHCGAVKGAVA